MGRPFYILTLFTAILQCLFGTLAGFVNGRSPFLYVFGKLAGALSIATWVWVAILLRYSRRPQSSNPLCRSCAHLVSFLILSAVWIAIGIMLATQMPWECGAKMLWCAAASFSSALAFCTGFSALGACVVIYRNVVASGAGLAVNVAQAHKRKQHLEHVPSFTTTPPLRVQVSLSTLHKPTCKTSLDSTASRTCVDS